MPSDDGHNTHPPNSRFDILHRSGWNATLTGLGVLSLWSIEWNRVALSWSKAVSFRRFGARLAETSLPIVKVFRMRIRSEAVWISLAVMGTIIGCAVEDSGPAVGSVAPEIQGEDVDGVRFQLSDYRGKVVVLDFWGDW